MLGLVEECEGAREARAPVAKNAHAMLEAVAQMLRATEAASAKSTAEWWKAYAASSHRRMLFRTRKARKGAAAAAKACEAAATLRSKRPATDDGERERRRQMRGVLVAPNRLEAPPRADCHQNIRGTPPAFEMLEDREIFEPFAGLLAARC